MLKFTGYTDTNDLVSQLGNIKYIGGRTNVADGLEKARTQVQTVLVCFIIVVITTWPKKLAFVSLLEHDFTGIQA